MRVTNEASAIEPENADANFNAALTRLCLGDFRQGWRQYEYRWNRAEYAKDRPTYPRPMWRGEKDLQGKTILLVAEQGLGDAIQFARYAPLVAALGAKVLLGARPSLTAVLATVPGVSQVIGGGQVLPDFDLYCPLLSLPLAFDTELATIPSNVPYLRPYEERLVNGRAGCRRTADFGSEYAGPATAITSTTASARYRSNALPGFCPSQDSIS